MEVSHRQEQFVRIRLADFQPIQIVSDGDFQNVLARLELVLRDSDALERAGGVKDFLKRADWQSWRTAG